MKKETKMASVIIDPAQGDLYVSSRVQQLPDSRYRDEVLDGQRVRRVSEGG
jgi:hypothetical protein